MKITPIKNYAKSIEFGLVDSLQTGNTKREFKLSRNIFFPEENNKVFRVEFEMNISNQKINLTVHYCTIFKCSKAINQTFKDSLFPKVNAPAIAYPFLRAFISTLTLNAGFEPVILSSINFTEFE